MARGSAEELGASLRSCARSLLSCFVFHKDMTFSYCSSTVDSLLGLIPLLFSPTCPVKL